MARKPNLGTAACPDCQRLVPVTSQGKYSSHWAGVGLRCPKSNQLVPPKDVQAGQGRKW